MHTFDHPTADEDALAKRVADGDLDAFELLMERHRDRLKAMVRLRISPELRRRVDESDIVQEALVQAALAVQTFTHQPERPFYLWLRAFAENKLLEARRHHLHTKKRAARREVHVATSNSSAILAEALVQSSAVSPSELVMRHERRRTVQQGLEALDPEDREVLILRHFEQMSFAEVGALLGTSKSRASHRYLAALARFREVAADIPGLLPELAD